MSEPSPYFFASAAKSPRLSITYVGTVPLVFFGLPSSISAIWETPVSTSRVEVPLVLPNCKAGGSRRQNRVGVKRDQGFRVEEVRVYLDVRVEAVANHESALAVEVSPARTSEERVSCYNRRNGNGRTDLATMQSIMVLFGLPTTVASRPVE